jgi:hypothetical protein
MDRPLRLKYRRSYLQAREYLCTNLKQTQYGSYSTLCEEACPNTSAQVIALEILQTHTGYYRNRGEKSNE